MTDPHLSTTAHVTCPYCGEVIAIAIDPAGGRRQDYVEDCQVCCRPWRVRVSIQQGDADVTIDRA